MERLEDALPNHDIHSAVKKRKLKLSQPILQSPKDASSKLDPLLDTFAKKNKLRTGDVSDIQGDWLVQPLESSQGFFDIDREQEMFYHGATKTPAYSQLSLSTVLCWNQYPLLRLLTNSSVSALYKLSWQQLHSELQLSDDCQEQARVVASLWFYAASDQDESGIAWVLSVTKQWLDTRPAGFSSRQTLSELIPLTATDKLTRMKACCWKCTCFLTETI